MCSYNSVSVILSATVATLAMLLLSTEAQAQHAGSFGISANSANNQAYFASNNYNLTTTISGHSVFVGKTDTGDVATNFKTYTPGPPVTLTIGAGTVIDYTPGFPFTSPVYPDFKYYQGVNVFGGNQVRVQGGSVVESSSFDNSTTDISGGNVTLVHGYNTSTLNFSGGTASNAYLYDSSTLNITGGVLDTVSTNNSSVLNLFGGRHSAVLIFDNSTASLYGTGLSFAYGGYNNGFGDLFQIDGLLQDGTVLNRFPIYVSNTSGTGNSTLHQISLVTVPESGTGGLIAIALLPFVAIQFFHRHRKIQKTNSGH